MNAVVVESGSPLAHVPPPELCWHVVCCKPRHEALAQENLHRQGFDVYLPKIQMRQRKRGQWVDTIQALFPRYLFVRIDRGRQSTATIRSTRGAVGLLSFGAEPAVVPDRVIEAIVQREDASSGYIVEKRQELCAGERVTLIEGPLSGIEGIFAGMEGGERAILLIELLGKTNKIRVKRDSVARVA